MSPRGSEKKGKRDRVSKELREDFLWRATYASAAQSLREFEKDVALERRVDDVVIGQAGVPEGEPIAVHGGEHHIASAARLGLGRQGLCVKVDGVERLGQVAVGLAVGLQLLHVVQHHAAAVGLHRAWKAVANQREGDL